MQSESRIMKYRTNFITFELDKFYSVFKNKLHCLYSHLDRCITGHGKMSNESSSINQFKEIQKCVQTTACVSCVLCNCLLVVLYNVRSLVTCSRTSLVGSRKNSDPGRGS